MRTSCIPHPEKEPLLVVRKWQIDFCNGDNCAAALLSFFEYWHNIKLNMAARNRRSNDVAEAHGDQRTQDESLRQFHTNEELKEGLLNLFSKNIISRGLKILEKLGAIDISRNPNPKYKFDRTNYFLFHPEVCTAFLEERKTKSGQSMVNYGRRSPTNDQAITETTNGDSGKKQTATSLRSAALFSSLHRDGLKPRDGEQQTWMMNTIAEILHNDRDQQSLHHVLQRHGKDLHAASLQMVKYGFDFSEKEEEFHNVLVDILRTMVEEETPLAEVPNAPVQFNYGGEDYDCNLSELKDPTILTNIVVRRILHGIACRDLGKTPLAQIIHSWCIRNHFRMSYWTFTPAHSTGNRTFRRAARDLCNTIYGAVCKTL